MSLFNLRRRLRKIHEESNLVVYDFPALMIYLLTSFTLLWMTTLKNSASLAERALADLAMIGLIIGMFGMLLTLVFHDKLKTRFELMPKQQPVRFPFKLIWISGSAMASLLLQLVVVDTLGQESLPIHAMATAPVYAFIFMLCMAPQEYNLFNLFFYRLGKLMTQHYGRAGPIIANISISVLFGFAYHAVFYDGSLGFMIAATIGCFIYNLSQEVTQWASGGMVPHLIQNFRPALLFTPPILLILPRIAQWMLFYMPNISILW